MIIRPNLRFVICKLPLKYITYFTDEDYGDQIGTVLGWGRTSSKADHSLLLMETHIPIIPIKICRKNSNYVALEIKSNMICAGYFNGSKDSCEVNHLFVIVLHPFVCRTF